MTKNVLEKLRIVYRDHEAKSSKPVHRNGINKAAFKSYGTTSRRNARTQSRVWWVQIFTSPKMVVKALKDVSTILVCFISDRFPSNKIADENKRYRILSQIRTRTRKLISTSTWN